MTYSTRYCCAGNHTKCQECPKSLNFPAESGLQGAIVNIKVDHLTLDTNKAQQGGAIINRMKMKLYTLWIRHLLAALPTFFSERAPTLPNTKQSEDLAITCFAPGYPSSGHTSAEVCLGEPD